MCVCVCGWSWVLVKTRKEKLSHICKIIGIQSFSSAPSCMKSLLIVC